VITGKSIDKLQVGDVAEFAKTISETDIYLYAGITGDFNPAHVNEAYAKNTFFKPYRSRNAHCRFNFSHYGQSIAGTGDYLFETGINFFSRLCILVILLPDESKLLK